MNKTVDINSDLTKYTLVENKDWKEVEVNGEPVEIPEEWGLKQLKECIEIEHGTRVLKKDAEGIYPVYGGGDSGFNWNTWNKKDKWVIARFALGEKCVRFVPGKFWLMDSGFTFSAKTNNSEQFFGYLFNALQSFLYSTLARGAAQKNMDMTMFINMTVKAPPLPEQTAIASVLSTQESIIADISLLISKHEQRLAWLSGQLLSGKLRVKRNVVSAAGVDESIVGDHNFEPVELQQLSFYQNPDDNWKEVEINGETVEIPGDWEVCVANTFLKGLKKSSVDLRSVKQRGALPVWGQEEGGASGYSDEKLSPIDASFENPVILFGDHTCAIKLIMEPFLTGGDGVKLFRSNFGDTKFAFFCLKNLGLKTLGYQRHYSILKEKPIAYPINERDQLLIVKVLSAQEGLISDYKKLLEKEKERMTWLSDALLSGKYRLQATEA